MSMMKSALASILLIAGATGAFAASEADFKAAYAAAEADSGDFDTGVAAAREAEALAKASIFQATSEKTRWKDMEIR